MNRMAIAAMQLQSEGKVIRQINRVNRVFIQGFHGQKKQSGGIFFMSCV